MKKVVVLGGGVAGMTAAMELAERGYEVTVFERRKHVAGGKARTEPVKGSGTDGRLPLMGEHGFRFFPGFYHHVPDTMKRIPFKGNENGCFGNLVSTEFGVIAPVGHPWFPVPVKLPMSLEALHDAFAVPKEVEALGITQDDMSFYLGRILKVLTSCKQRRLEEFGRQSWWDFVDADQRSEAYQVYLATGETRNAVATKAQKANARTIGDVATALLFNASVPGESADRVLTLPTNDAWINPWLAHLESLGVKWHFDSVCTAIDFKDGRITGVRVKSGDGEDNVTADYYVSALPVEILTRLLEEQRDRAGSESNDAITNFDPVLQGLFELQDQIEWMNGIQFYLTEDIKGPKGHWNCLLTPWALTAISEIPFWKSLSMADYGDGTIRSVLSVDISDWESPGMPGGPAGGKSAMECTADEIAAETWHQLRLSMNTKEEILPEKYHQYWLDDDVQPGKGPHKEVNLEPLLVNLVESWDLRPDAYTRIPNFYIAGDFVRTNTDFASMEGANEAARRAVNALLIADGFSGAPGLCEIWDPYEPSFLAPFRAHDERQFRKGLPWMSPMKLPQDVALAGHEAAHEIKDVVKDAAHYLNPVTWFDWAADKVENVYADYTGSSEAEKVLESNRILGKEIPDRPWIVLQHWRDLGFVHYQVEKSAIRHLVHESLEIDEWDGSAWITVVPMRMVGLKFRFVGGIPWESSFPELNLRTYVTHNGRPGVFFFRIDATKRLADWAARTFFHLPYDPADISFQKRPDGSIWFTDHSLAEGAHAGNFAATIRPKGEPFSLDPDSKPYFLSERYSAYTTGRHGKLLRGDVMHDPWVFRDVDIEVHHNSLWESVGIDVPEQEPSFNYSSGVTTVLWPMVDAETPVKS